jgi:hypothetical protein
MTIRKTYFIGLLQNVDSSILKVKLEHNFKFESISKKEGSGIFSILENLDWGHTINKLFMEYPCLNVELDRYFFVENSFDVTISDDGRIYGGELSEFDQLVHSYLFTKIRLMRLFKEGNIKMPLTYFFSKDPLKSVIKGSMFATYSHGPLYTLGGEEVSQLQDFIKNTKMPFRDYIQLAFDNLELSYEIWYRDLTFFCLMKGLEGLFYPGEGKIRSTISKNCAALLSEDKKENEIFRNLKKFYELRSKIAHGFTKIDVKEEELIQLRGYLRESIKKLLQIDKPREEVLKSLESGFKY